MSGTRVQRFRRRVAALLAGAGMAWLLGVAASVRLESSPLQSAPAQDEHLPAGAGSELVRARCLGCHGPELIVQQRLSRAGWARALEKMIGWGAAVDAAEVDPMVDYLARHLGAAGLPAAAGNQGLRLVETRCLACHDLLLIEQQRLDTAGWTRAVDKMVGWGALLTDAERAALIAYLAARWPVRPLSR